MLFQSARWIAHQYLLLHDWIEHAATLFSHSRVREPVQADSPTLNLPEMVPLPGLDHRVKVFGLQPKTTRSAPVFWTFDAWLAWEPFLSILPFVRPFALSATTASAEFSLRYDDRRPFRRKVRSPQVRARSFPTQALLHECLQKAREVDSWWREGILPFQGQEEDVSRWLAFASPTLRALIPDRAASRGSLPLIASPSIGCRGNWMWQLLPRSLLIQFATRSSTSARNWRSASLWAMETNQASNGDGGR